MGIEKKCPFFAFLFKPSTPISDDDDDDDDDDDGDEIH